MLSWDIVQERTSDALQACPERALQAKQYYSDVFPAYDTLHCVGLYTKKWTVS